MSVLPFVEYNNACIACTVWRICPFHDPLPHYDNVGMDTNDDSIRLKVYSSVCNVYNQIPLQVSTKPPYPFPQH